MSSYWHKYLNEGEETALSHRRIQLLNVEERNQIAPLGKHTNNNCYNQDLLMDIKINV